MNRKIGMISSLINVFSVVSFAICMLAGFNFGNYFGSMFIAFSFVPMITSFIIDCDKDKKVAGYTAMIFSGMYATFILAVYFAQVTSVLNDDLPIEALRILDFQKFGLLFNYDLLGYGLMSLATFFIGLTIDVNNKVDKWLKSLLLIHGIFFISCFVIPMLGLFTAEMKGQDLIGVIILEFWCLYFIPVGILTFLHFKNNVNK